MKARRTLFFGAAITATLVALPLLARLRSPGNSIEVSIPRTRLLQILGPVRPVSGRLSGFEHAPLGTRISLSAARRTSSRARELRALAETSPSAEVFSDVAILELLDGDLQKAARRLQRVVESGPNRPWILADLAAVELELADRQNDPLRLFSALDAADAAVQAQGASGPAYFNRALVLEALHLHPTAIRAWKTFLREEPHSGWAAEARQHLKRLARPQGRELWPQARTRLVGAVLRQNQPLVISIVAEFSQPARQLAEEELLADWARHLLAARENQANKALALARSIGMALTAVTTDRLLQDCVTAIDGAPPLRKKLFAEGHLRFAEGLAYFKDENYGAAAGLLLEGQRQLELAGSPFAGWVALYQAICQYYVPNPAAVRHLLDRARELTAGRPYLTLAARIAWISGLVAYDVGNTAEALAKYEHALAGFVRCREREHVAAVHNLLAVVYDHLNDPHQAWAHRTEALRLLPYVHSIRYRHVVLDTAGSSLVDQHPRTALYFQDQVVALVRESGKPFQIAIAYWRRSLILKALEHFKAAEYDIARARRAAAAIEDEQLQREVEADIDMAEGLILSLRRPRVAIASLTRALDFYEATEYRFTVASLYLHRARNNQRLGRFDLAEVDLISGINECERQRMKAPENELRISYLDYLTPIYDEMVTLKLAQPSGVPLAFRYAEQRRARQVLDTLEDFPQDDQSRVLDPVGLDEVRASLPRGTALLSYVQHRGFLHIFVIPGPHGRLIVKTRRDDQLVANANAVEQSMLRGSCKLDCRRGLIALYNSLIRTVAAELQAVQALVIVPDKNLHVVPFAALLDEQTGHYLVEKFRLTIAPSATLYSVGKSASEGPGLAPADDRPHAR